MYIDNLSGKDVQLNWFSYDGTLTPYDVIKADTSIVQHTFATHPWEARVTDGSDIEILIDGMPVYTPGRFP